MKTDIDILKATWPEAFCKPRKPLKLGIHEDIAVAMPDLPPERLNGAMRYWTSGWAYLDKMKAGATRVDLSGQPAGTVTDAAARTAAGRLKSSMAKAAAKKKKTATAAAA